MMGELDSILLTSFVFVFLSFHLLESKAIEEETLGRCCVKPSVALLEEEEEESTRETRCAPLENDANRTLPLIEDNSETTSSVVDSWVCFDACFEYQPNGSFVVLRTFENRSELLDVKTNGKVNGSLCKMDDEVEKKRQDGKTCQSIGTPLNFWGANIVVLANLIYIVPYFFVIIMYSTVSGLRKRAYDGAVISWNITQIILNSILIGVGWSRLCGVFISLSVYTFTCLALIFLTVASTVWLFIIGIDMTLVITRFRWTPATDPGQQRAQEKRKFLVYSAWGWGVSLVPTALACIVGLSPLVPITSIFKPKFENSANGPTNITILVYALTLPVLILLMNSGLFCYTTYKIIVMKKSTSIASRTATKAKESYFMFLKLYLLMDAPWLTGALGSIYPELWLFKFIRMTQPILMLIVILPKGTLANIVRKCRFSKLPKEEVNNVKNTEDKRNYSKRSTVTRL